MTADQLASIRQRAHAVAWAGPAKTVEEARTRGVDIRSLVTAGDAQALLDALDQATALVGELREAGIQWMFGNQDRDFILPDQLPELFTRRLPWEASE